MLCFENLACLVIICNKNELLVTPNSSHERERAALKWTEALTPISETNVPDSLYKTVREYFDEEEMMALIMAGPNRAAMSRRKSYNLYLSSEGIDPLAI